MSSDSDSAATSDCDDDSIISVKIPADSRRIRFGIFATLQSVMALEGARQLPTYSLRLGNMHRDRYQIIKWAAELDEKMFCRQFRLCREDFFYVLMKVTPDLKKNSRQAINSSGSEISPQLMLMITLRILAGASYLDMIHYRVHVDSVSTIVWNTVQAIHARIDNITLASSEVACMKLAREWAAIQLQRWGQHLTAGTIYAGDGLAIEISQPSEADLRNRPLSVFRNRKGFWALIAQGFCDAYTRFGVFDVKWPGGTNDIIAYQMTEIYQKAKNDVFPIWATFVLDEAYSSCGGMHLTPYSRYQLIRAKAVNESQYLKMLAFNNVLSSQRITIERAFGILVRRWGILWKPISYSLCRVAKIARVCAMLHNICVDRWLLKNPRLFVNNTRVWPDVPNQYAVDDPMPRDEAVIGRLHNNYAVARTSSHDNSLRTQLTQDIFDAGIATFCNTEYHNIN